MPNIQITFPEGAYPGEHRNMLIRKLNEAAAAAERIPDSPAKRFTCWVHINELAPGKLTCGGQDMSAQALPCVALIHVPEGVLNDAMRTFYVHLVHEAFKKALPASEKRQLFTSIMLHEVQDGTWGANGQLWRLADFVNMAGYTHLQHLSADA
jgi:phenylpyruvate tautomerase PptA (4-oxalocrotonate tautomerase family)